MIEFFIISCDERDTADRHYDEITTDVMNRFGKLHWGIETVTHYIDGTIRLVVFSRELVE